MRRLLTLVKKPEIQVAIRWRNWSIPFLGLLIPIINQFGYQFGAWEQPVLFPLPIIGDEVVLGFIPAIKLPASFLVSAPFVSWWLIPFLLALGLYVIYLLQESKSSWLWWWLGMFFGYWDLWFLFFFYKIVF